MNKNKNKNKNVFVVLTEYQFLQALNIAIVSYNELDFTNVIYILNNGIRFKEFKLDRETILNNTKIIFLKKYKPKEIVNMVLNEKPNHFYFFQAINPVNVFLGHILSKKGVEVSLGPDGYIAYSKFNKKHKLLSFLRDTFTQNKYLIKNNLLTNTIIPFDFYSFGNHKFINNIWLTHPEQYIHKSKNRVNICKLPNFSEKTLKFIKDSYGFEEEIPLENVIYFFNQPFWGDLIQIEIDFLEQIINKFPEKEIIIKLHPLTSQDVIKKYKKFKTVKLIESSIPAEVILLNLKNCIVFSGWSTVLITENKSCNYYFNYPVYKKEDDKILNQIEITALNHINFINSVEEMQFPNG